MTKLTPEQAYETYVGSITPGEFVSPFEGSADAAINSLLVNWPWNCEIPENLEHDLMRYLESQGVA